MTTFTQGLEEAAKPDWKISRNASSRSRSMTSPLMRFKHQDKSYAEAIDYLMAHPQEVYGAWGDPRITRGGSLFLHCSPSGELAGGIRCGCVTQVHTSKGFNVVGFPNSEEMTKRIQADERIPDPNDWDENRGDSEDPWSPPTRETLELFAVYQTEMDEMSLAMKEEES